MDFKEKTLEKINEMLKLNNNDKTHYSLCLLKEIIFLCDVNKFNEMIQMFYYNNPYSNTFESCSHDLHKGLRQMDLLQNSNIDMLLYNYIALSNRFFYDNGDGN